jgi:4-hydroxybenzoate polyprenyltransferase
MNTFRTGGIPKKILLLINISRPPLWLALPLIFCLGLAYGQNGFGDPRFRWSALMVLQMVWLSFPICLYTFGLNDIFDEASDKINPRKGGLEGIRLDQRHRRLIKKAALGAGIIFLSLSFLTRNVFNIFYTSTILCLAYVYSAPPWRLKTRPPLDVVSAGIMGFLAPFGLGFGFVDHAAALPLQAYYFTFCVMGFHAFSTIMDYDVDKKAGDITFAVAYGKRIAAALPGIVFLLGPFFVEAFHVKIFFLLCASLSFFTAMYPSEKLARHFFLLMYPAAVLTLALWLFSFVR